MKTIFAATTVLLLSRVAYGASSITPSVPVDPRTDAVTGCEVTNATAAALAMAVTIFDPEGRVKERGSFTVPGHGSRLFLADPPVDGFHCRFVTDTGLGTYRGAAKYYFIDGDGDFVERSYPDR
jgi:hypothetical protein